MPRSLKLLLLSTLPAFFLMSCAGPQVREETEEIRKRLDQARAQGAKRCAPIELAVAEANFDFAVAELGHGNAGRAQEHVDLADKAVGVALENSKGCAPKPKKAPVVVKVERKDTDKDGLLDPDDKCPTDPEDFDQFEDEDGCPDRDNDNDLINDEFDKCPNAPEDLDMFEDEDGCAELDNDLDTLPDLDDACPLEAGPVANKGCPVLDRDGDGIKDPVDQCPDQPEDKDSFEDENGCPDPDNDADEVLDVNDSCPIEAGIPELAGCPPRDRDGDNVPDHLDRCPDEAGVIEEQGCPRKYTLVVLRQERIEIREQVHFANNKFQILKDSFPLLNQIAQVLQDNPKIKLRIEGHTDSVANDNFNLKLSQSRADAVRTYLVKAGIAADRLVAKGFGEERPIASNAKESGRAANRRVEFNISER